MAGPLRTLTRLTRLAAEDPESSLKPEEVGRAMDAVKTILARGLPDKDQVYRDRKLPGALRKLSAFYAAPGEEVSGSGDRLYREEADRLSHGLADVADRLLLASALRKARGEAGFSIRGLSRFSGVDHSYISRVERGAVPRPSRAVMERLAAPLGVGGLSTSPPAVTAATGPPAAPNAPNETGRPGPDLAQLGLHRAAVRGLLRVARDLPDEHLELLEAQARAIRETVKKKRG